MKICEIGLNHMSESINKILHLNVDGLIFHLREKSFYQYNFGSKFLLTNDFYYKISKKLKNKIKFGIYLLPKSIVTGKKQKMKNQT
jgi:hypothetical protein